MQRCLRCWTPRIGGCQRGGNNETVGAQHAAPMMNGTTDTPRGASAAGFSRKEKRGETPESGIGSTPSGA